MNQRDNSALFKRTERMISKYSRICTKVQKRTRPHRRPAFVTTTPDWMMQNNNSQYNFSKFFGPISIQRGMDLIFWSPDLPIPLINRVQIDFRPEHPKKYFLLWVLFFPFHFLTIFFWQYFVSSFPQCICKSIVFYFFLCLSVFSFCLFFLSFCLFFLNTKFC